MSVQERPWTMDGFLKDFNSEDQDHVYIALKGLLAHLQKVPYFKEFEKNGDFMIPHISNRILDDENYLSNPTLLTIFDTFMKIIVPLSGKAPLRFVPILYDLLFSKISRGQVRYFTALGSVLEDSISQCSNYDQDRQKKIAEYMINKLTQYVNNPPSPEMQNLSLNLLTVTVETLSHCLTPAMIDQLKNLIHSLSDALFKREDTNSKGYLTLCESLSTVSKVYSTIVGEEEKRKLLDFIEEKSQDGKNKPLCTYILSTIIAYRPQFFSLEADKEEKYTFKHYLEVIFEEVQNPPQQDEYSEVYVAFTVQYLSALSALVDRFGDKFTQEQRTSCINADFDLINLGSSGITEEVEAGNDNDFIVDGLGEEDDDDEADAVAAYVPTDDSWQIRVAAMKFAVSLIEEEKIGNEYFAVLTESTEEIYNPIYLNNLICDHDIGAKLEAVNFFKVILHRFKNELTNSLNDILEDWLAQIISQINLKEKDQVLNSFIDTISFAMNEIQAPPSLDLSLDAIANVTDVYRDNTIDKTLLFITNILEYSSQKEIVSPIINLAHILLEKARSHMLPKCLTIASKVYYYVYLHCAKDSSLNGELEALNEKVIQFLQQQGEVKPYAVTTISVFVSCCPGLSTVQKSTDLITNFLDDPSVNRAATTSISLIAVSGSSQTLSHDISNILDKLKKNLQLSDAIMTNISLWAISLMLYKNILQPKDTDKIIDILFSIINNGEKGARYLSLKILNRIYANGCDSKRLCSLAECLSTSVLSERIINEIAQLSLASSKSSLDNIKPFIDDLINKVGDGSNIKDGKIISNIALIIGITSSTNKDYALSLVSSFKGHVNDKGRSQEFALRSIGEIGSFVDLSSTNSDLVDSVFNLVHSTERSVFVPASESFGLMAVGSPNSILEKLISSAKTDNENFLTPWLFAINSFAKKTNLVKNYISKDVYDQIVKRIPSISEFLLKNAKNDSDNTATTVAECLAGLVGISFDFSQTLINQPSYITIYAISIYMENYSPYSYRNGHKRNLTDKEKEEILGLIGKIDKKYDDSNPMLDYAIMLCLKFAITKNLTQELFDSGIKDRFIDATKLLNCHRNVKTVGTILNAEDIGRSLRLTAITCLELLIKSKCADQLDYDAVGGVVFNAILDEKYPNILQKALDIITLLSKSTIPEAHEFSDYYVEDCTIIDALKRFETMWQNPSNEVSTSYYNALLSIQTLPSMVPEEIRKVKNILSRNQNDPVLVKILDENKFKGQGTSTEAYFTNGYVSSRLMEELYPDAASIFVNN